MSRTIGKAMVAVSCIALLHAAFSTYEYLSTLKALSLPERRLPISITAEAIIALLLFLPGTTLATAKLRDITARGELAKRTMEENDARMGFMIPSARGRALFGEARAGSNR